MLHQGTFDLERPNQMPSALDHVVGSADEEPVAIGVAHRKIAGEIPAIREAFAVALFLMEVGPHH